ncbi:MAG: hypothetical protein LBR26_01065 [Prevotella sp.]|nr:hypothetical protein [Prevotella sp.]
MDQDLDMQLLITFSFIVYGRYFLLSALLEGREYIGIEKNEDVLLHKVQPVDYIKVCNDRITEIKQGLKNKAF